MDECKVRMAGEQQSQEAVQGQGLLLPLQQQRERKETISELSGVRLAQQFWKKQKEKEEHDLLLMMIRKDLVVFEV